MGVPDAPFIVATLGDFVVESHPEALIVNKALGRIPQRVKYTACVDSDGLEHKGDNVHFGSESARELGRRYAKAISSLDT